MIERTKEGHKLTSGKVLPIGKPIDYRTLSDAEFSELKKAKAFLIDFIEIKAEMASNTSKIIKAIDEKSEKHDSVCPVQPEEIGIIATKQINKWMVKAVLICSSLATITGVVYVIANQ